MLQIRLFLTSMGINKICIFRPHFRVEQAEEFGSDFFQRIRYFFAPFYEPPKQSSKFQHQNHGELWVITIITHVKMLKPDRRDGAVTATAFEKLSREVVSAVVASYVNSQLEN